MRTKMMLQEYLDFGHGSTSVKVVREWQGKYEAIDFVLRTTPGVLTSAHADLSELSESREGRKSKYTSEEILRALIVMFVEGDDYRGVVIRIDSSPFLRWFVGIGEVRDMMDFTFLSRGLSALSEETLQAMNGALRAGAVKDGKISGDRLRADTTVVEANIHYPTDSGLLWDCFRVLARELKGVQKRYPELELSHRFHTKKAKREHIFISRYANSRCQKRRRLVKGSYRKLTRMTRSITAICREIIGVLPGWSLEGPMLERLEGLASRVVDQAQKRVLDGINVPCDEKVFSIFEEHTELIKRGKANKPVEFGHKVVLSQTKEKFISQYDVLFPKQEDRVLVDSLLNAHRATFGKHPKALSLDEGFYESATQLKTLRKKIGTVSLRKKGKLTEEEQALEKTKEFAAGQRFRAGIEGCISLLKRAFKLSRCLFKGFTTTP